MGLGKDNKAYISNILKVAAEAKSCEVVGAADERERAIIAKGEVRLDKNVPVLVFLWRSRCSYQAQEEEKKLKS